MREMPMLLPRGLTKRSTRPPRGQSGALTKLRADAHRLIPESLPRSKRFAHLALHPGFRTLVLQRFQESAHQAGWAIVEQVILNANFVLSGAEFRPGSSIGAGAVIRHPAGIVIGSGVQIGENCTLQHGVTVGEKYVDDRSDGCYPTIGSGVVFGTHSVVVGDIHIGNDAIIGALTFVDADVEDGTTVVGGARTTARPFSTMREPAEQTRES